jgi:hypothetical protein
MTRKKVEPVVFNEPVMPDIFADLEEAQRRNGRYREDEGKRRSVAFGACPLCTNHRVGLVPQGRHLAWRDHNRHTHGGASLQCGAVGQHLCDLPARDASAWTSDPAPTCTCER